jgi:hypothetical protein
MVMKALTNAKLHLNPAKCSFFLLEVDFLGHHISAHGIEPNSSKVEKILNWPVPQNSTDVHAYWDWCNMLPSSYLNWWITQ